MPELLTRRETPQSVVGRLAGFKSEWWPDLFRNGGRHQFGTMAGFPSEYLAGFNRNPQSIGRTLVHMCRAYVLSVDEGDQYQEIWQPAAKLML